MQFEADHRPQSDPPCVNSTVVSVNIDMSEILQILLFAAKEDADNPGRFIFAVQILRKFVLPETIAQLIDAVYTLHNVSHANDIQLSLLANKVRPEDVLPHTPDLSFQKDCVSTLENANSFDISTAPLAVRGNQEINYYDFDSYNDTFSNTNTAYSTHESNTDTACSTHESNTDTACSTHESNTDIPTYFLVTTQSICQSSSITTERKFVCSNLECTKTFKTKHACQSHEISHSDKRPFLCNFPDCSYTTARNHDLSRHKKKHDPKYRQSCDLCKHSYARSDCLKKHVCNPTIGSDERDAPKRLKWSRRNKFLPSSPSD